MKRPPRMSPWNRNEMSAPSLIIDLGRSSNNQSKGNTPQPNAILPNSTITNTASSKTMTSVELDPVRAGTEQQVEHISQPQPRDVTRVVKILKQNEPLVRQRFSTRYYLNIFA